MACWEIHKQWRYGQTFTSLQKGPSTKYFIYGALDKVQFSRFCVIDFNLDRNSMSMRTRFQEAMSFNKDWHVQSLSRNSYSQAILFDSRRSCTWLTKFLFHDHLRSQHGFMHMFHHVFMIPTVLLFQVQELFHLATGFGDSFRFQVSPLLISKRSQDNTADLGEKTPNRRLGSASYRWSPAWKIHG